MEAISPGADGVLRGGTVAALWLPPELLPKEGLLLEPFKRRGDTREASARVPGAASWLAGPVAPTAVAAAKALPARAN